MALRYLSTRASLCCKYFHVGLISLMNLGKLSRLSFDEAMYELSSCFEKDLGEGSIKRFELIDAICRRSLSSFKRFRISTSASLPIPSSIDEFVSLNLEGSGENSFSGSAENEIT